MSFPTYPEYKLSASDWLGEVPSHWDVHSFRHCFRESTEKIDHDVVGPMLSVSGYRGIEIKEYDDENRRRTSEELIGYRIVRNGQLVVNTMWLNYAGLGVSAFDGHVSPAYRCYDIDARLDRDFVHHLMRSERYVIGYTKFLTGIRPNSLQMGRDDLMIFPVLIPPKPEQIAIAAFLDLEAAKIDALVAEQEKLIALLKEKRQALISHAVTKGLDPNAPMKDSGIEWLGQVPVHWDVLPFQRRISGIEQGYSPNASNEPCELDGLGVLKISAVKFGHFICEENKALLNDAQFDPSIRVEPNDLLITRANTPDLVGDCCVVPDNVPPGLMMSDLIYRVRLADGTDPRFISYFLRGTFARAQIRSDARGSSMTMAKISQRHISSWVLTLPPLDEQERIRFFLDREESNFRKLEDEASCAIRLLKERRSALISAAVTGKIDVRGLASLPAQAHS